MSAIAVPIVHDVASVGAVGSYDNASIADTALTFWNGSNGQGAASGSAACQAAKAQYGYSADSGGQCRAFVNCVVVLASHNAQHVGGGTNYFSGFLNAGGVEITDIGQLSKGDIVQIGDGSDPNNLHTFIIVAPVSGSQFMVVDSNHDPKYPETVNYYERNVALNSNSRAFRMGTVNTNVAPSFTGDSPPYVAHTYSPYSYGFHATGSPSPTFSVASGTIPLGLTLSASGTLSGTATTPGTYSFVVQASNVAGTDTTPELQVLVSSVRNYSDGTISNPRGIVTGSDGAIWFTNEGNGSIGKITAAGSISNYTSPMVVSPNHITAGPDGNLWFTDCGADPCEGAGWIGRVTTAGVFATFEPPNVYGPTGITPGPDHASVWFAEWNNNWIARMSLSGRMSHKTYVGDAAGDIVSGPDGALWVAGGSSIARVTTTGSLKVYRQRRIGSTYDIAVGSDGALWFTRFGGSFPHYNYGLGRITTSGSLTIFKSPAIYSPLGITSGPDGALWFTDYYGDSIDRMTTAGQLTIYTDPTISHPSAIATGPDGALWFTNSGNNSIGRIPTP